MTTTASGTRHVTEAVPAPGSSVSAMAAIPAGPTVVQFPPKQPVPHYKKSVFEIKCTYVGIT